MTHGQVLVPVQQGLSFVGGAFYGTNAHDVGSPNEGATSKLSGVLAGLLYRAGDRARPGVFFFWEGGLVKNTVYASDLRIAYSGGVGLAIPLSFPLELRISGSYLGVLFDTDIAFWDISAGIHVRMGGKY